MYEYHIMATAYSVFESRHATIDLPISRGSRKYCDSDNVYIIKPSSHD